jgi:DNA-directed RNA polymerase specialized sigma24 family protein
MTGAEDDVEGAMLQAMRAAAVYQARRVARTLKLTPDEREDVEQDILLVLLERRRFFDPARGPWVPFAHQIARQAAQSVADRLVAARKLGTVSLSEKAIVHDDREASAIGAAIADESAPTETGILDAMSLLAFVRGLPIELRIAAEAALEADGELAEAQRATGLSTSEFYRRMREIRYRMVMVGLIDRRVLRPLGKKTAAPRYLQGIEAIEGANDLSGKNRALARYLMSNR